MAFKVNRTDDFSPAGASQNTSLAKTQMNYFSLYIQSPMRTFMNDWFPLQ
jgi:hypothetical protein